MSDKRNPFEGFGSELKNRLRDDFLDRLDEAAFEERIDCIDKTVKAFKEVGIEDEEIIRLLQKYWDLRRSEAISFLDE